jgi:3'(2'), 5'-bisphosphate nucleotidase
LYIGGNRAYRLKVRTTNGAPSFSNMRPIAVRRVSQDKERAVASRSHLGAVTEEWVKLHAIEDLRPCGFSLRFCAIADGEADFYPRLAPTMEWETAAGHIVLLAAGGSVTDLNGRPFEYGKPNYRNGGFVASALPHR